MVSSSGFAVAALLLACVNARWADPKLASVELLNTYVRTVQKREGRALDLKLSPYLPLTDSKLPAVSILTPQLHTEAVRKRIRYGPFNVPGFNETTLQTILGGEKGDYNTFNTIDPICTDCLVLFGNITLQREDGTAATEPHGTYFHHAAMINFNKKRAVYMCSNEKEMVPMIGGGPAQFLAGINEEGANWYTDYKTGQYKSGYYITKTDKFGMLTQIMNYSPLRKKVWVSVDVEYIQGRPAGWSNTVNPILSVSSCKHANVDFLPPTPHYEKQSPPWTSTWTGTILNTLGHLHDGGDRVEIVLNDQLICNSTAIYNPTTDPEQSALSTMKECKILAPIKTGDKMSLRAIYDSGAHAMRMGVSGKKEAVMGLASVFIAVPFKGSV